MSDHEGAFIKRFIVPTKRQRYLGFISEPRLRHKFLRELHNLPIDHTYATVVQNSQGALISEANLRRLGSGDNVYLIADHTASDQKWFPLAEGLRAEYEDVIVCCKAGELAVYFAERITYLLFRPRGPLKAMKARS